MLQSTIILVKDRSTSLRHMPYATDKGWVVIYYGGIVSIEVRASVLQIQLDLNVPAYIMCDVDKAGLDMLATAIML